MTARFSRNMAFNVAGLIVPALTSLVTIPFYIEAIGAARYGLVSITWILLGYFGFLDFGLSRASANALSRLGPDAGPEARSPVLVTAFYLNALFGLVASAVIYLAAVLMLPSLPMDAALHDEARAAVPWIVPMLPLGMVVGVATGALESREHFLLSNATNSFGLVLTSLLPLLAVHLFGPSLTVVLPALVLVRLGVAVAMIATVLRIEWPITRIRPDLGWARRLFGYGVWVSVSSLISPMLETFDQLLIGRLLGPAAVAHYAVPMSLALRSQIVAVALSKTLFPRLSREDGATARRLTEHATMALIYGFGALCGPAILIAHPFLSVWISPDFAAQSSLVAAILLFGAWLNGIAFLPFNQIQAQGRPHLTARVHAAEVVPFLLGLWLLILWIGLPGAALAWTLRVGIDCGVLLWLAGLLGPGLLRALPAFGLMLACFAAAWAWAPPLPVASGLACLAGLAFLSLGLLVEPAIRDVARRLSLHLPRPLRFGESP